MPLLVVGCKVHGLQVAGNRGEHHIAACTIDGVGEAKCAIIPGAVVQRKLRVLSSRRIKNDKFYQVCWNWAALLLRILDTSLATLGFSATLRTRKILPLMCRCVAQRLGRASRRAADCV